MVAKFNRGVMEMNVVPDSVRLQYLAFGLAIAPDYLRVEVSFSLTRRRDFVAEKIDYDSG